MSRPWQVLRPAEPGGGIILAVDFGPRTNQPGFNHLARELPPGAGLYQTVPPAIGDDLRHETSPGRYAGHWTKNLPSGESPILAVVTFCAAVHFTGEFTDALAATMTPPVVMSIDPSEVSAASLTAEFIIATESLRAYLDEEATDSIADTCRSVAGDDDLVSVADRLRGAHRTIVESAGDRVRLPAHLIAGLSARFANYLGYLVAAGRSVAATAPHRVIVSAGHVPSTGSASPLTRLPTPHEELLSDPEVARLVHAAIPAVDPRCSTTPTSSRQAQKD